MEGQVFEAHSGLTREWHVKGHFEQSIENFVASRPPALARLTLTLDGDVAAACHAAALDIVVLDRSPSSAAPGVPAMLIQAEAIASCLLDGVVAGVESLAKAESGQPSSTQARRVTAAAGSLAAHLDNASKAVSLGAIAAAHTRPRRMASGAVSATPYRATHSWLGGSDLWPRGASYVAPPPELVPELMTDLVEFCGRDDLDPILQAAVAYAQVMSIQPFADGNARVARAVVNGVLRRRGLTTRVAIPLSASLVGHDSRLEWAWKAYREGQWQPIVVGLAKHLSRAAAAATPAVRALEGLPAAWRRKARPRRNSASDKLIDRLCSFPLVNASEVQRLTGASQASAYEAIARLAEADVLVRVSPTKRESMWCALDVFTQASSLVESINKGTRHKVSKPRQRSGRRAGA